MSHDLNELFHDLKQNSQQGYSSAVEKSLLIKRTFIALFTRKKNLKTD